MTRRRSNRKRLTTAQFGNAGLMQLGAVFWLNRIVGSIKFNIVAIEILGSNTRIDRRFIQIDLPKCICDDFARVCTNRARWVRDRSRRRSLSRATATTRKIGPKDETTGDFETRQVLHDAFNIATSCFATGSYR